MHCTGNATGLVFRQTKRIYEGVAVISPGTRGIFCNLVSSSATPRKWQQSRSGRKTRQIIIMIMICRSSSTKCLVQWRIYRALGDSGVQGAGAGGKIIFFQLLVTYRGGTGSFETDSISLSLPFDPNPLANKLVKRTCL